MLDRMHKIYLGGIIAGVLVGAIVGAVLAFPVGIAIGAIAGLLPGFMLGLAVNAFVHISCPEREKYIPNDPARNALVVERKPSFSPSQLQEIKDAFKEDDVQAQAVSRGSSRRFFDRSNALGDSGEGAVDPNQRLITSYFNRA